MTRRFWLILAAACVVWLVTLSVDIRVVSEAEAGRYSRGSNHSRRGSIRHHRGGARMRGTKHNSKGRRGFKSRGKRGNYGSSMKRGRHYKGGSNYRHSIRRHRSTKSRGKKGRGRY